ncbi:hypothetical protein Tco_1352355 [Tanacetum coccineum]
MTKTLVLGGMTIGKKGEGEDLCLWGEEMERRENEEEIGRGEMKGRRRGERGGMMRSDYGSWKSCMDIERRTLVMIFLERSDISVFSLGGEERERQIEICYGGEEPEIDGDLRDEAVEIEYTFIVR